VAIWQAINTMGDGMSALARLWLIGIAALLYSPALAGTAYQGTIIMNFSAPADKMLGAHFTPAGLPPRPCNNVQPGNCCRPPDVSAAGGSAPAHSDVNAGDIIFLRQGVLLGELKPPAAGRPYASIYTTLVNEVAPGAADWEPGDVILVRSSGGIIPPFSITAATPPPLIGLNLPLPVQEPGISPANGPRYVSLAINRPIIVSWTPAPGAPPDASVDVTVTDYTDKAVLLCRANDRAGHVNVQYISPPNLPFNKGDKGAIVITRTYATIPAIQPANARIEVEATASTIMSVAFTARPNNESEIMHEGMGFIPDKVMTGPNGTGPLFAHAPGN
jgi:hypothetical protein